MSKEKMCLYGQTDMGRQRTNNEDAFVAKKLDDNTILLIAIDGVGGYEGGEVAAEIAQKEIPAYLEKYGRGERLELLKQAVVYANNAIYDRRQEDADRPEMSCVLTAALIDKGRKVVDMVHVGDTRMYQFHHGMLSKLSHDHSLIGYREEIGDLTEDEAMHHPQRNVISRDVGSARHEVGDSDFLEAEEFPLLPNSTFLLCSDGLTDLITSKQIVATLEQQLSLEKKAKMLIDAANEAGGKDNITVVLAEYQAEEVVAPKQVDEKPPIENENDEVVPVAIGGEKLNDKKWIPIMLIVVSLLFFAACVAFIVSQNHVKELKMQMEEMEKQMDPSANDSLTNSIKDIINRYTKACDENDTASIARLFATDVRDFHDAHDLSNAQVVEKHDRYDQSLQINGKKTTIKWETLKAMYLPSGELFIVYLEDYSDERADTTKPSKFLIEKYIVLDTNGKIVSLDDMMLESK